MMSGGGDEYDPEPDFDATVGGGPRLERDEEDLIDHEYEPGDVRHPMETDPACRICGRARRACENGR